MKLPESVKVAAASLGLGGAIGAALVAFLLAGECSGWRQDHPKPPKPVPQVLAPTAAELEMQRVIEDCLAVETLQPTPKERKRIARESGRADFAAQPVAPQANAAGVVPPPHLGGIARPGAASEPDYPVLLAEKEVPPMPDGGRAWVWLEQDASVTVVTKANDPKPQPADRFWQFGNVYEIGGLYGIGQGGDTRARVWAAIEPLRAGRIHLRAEAGVDLRNGGTDGYVMGGAVWRSR